MPRRNLTPPRYGRHRPTDQARVVVNGKSHYLGRYGSPESRKKYAQLVARWEAARGSLPPNPKPSGERTVVELVASYLSYVQTYYVKNGRPTHEQEGIRQALRHVMRLYGQTPAAEFGPLALKTVRQSMIEAGWCRSTINNRFGRVKRMFKWAVENELVPPSLYHGLQAVAGLRKGRSGVREAEPVRRVHEAHVDAIRPHVSRQVWAMIQLQRLTGMRPGEVVIMRACDLDLSGELWEYRPSSHKGEYLDQERIIPLGPRSQEVIQPFLKCDLQAHLFSPAEAEAERRAAAHANRKTPLSCGNRPGSNRRAKPKRTPQHHYTVGSYGRAVQRACKKTFPPPEGLSEDQLKHWRKSHFWHPHQLRHNAGTKIRKELGLEAAQVYLGHSKADVTQIYAERNLELARQIAARFG